MTNNALLGAGIGALLLWSACDTGSAGHAPEDAGGHQPQTPETPLPEPVEEEEPGKPVQLTPKAASEATFSALSQQIAEARAIDRATFDQTYKVAFEPLGYDPLAAVNLDQIQMSSFALGTEQLQTLSEQGFVIQRDTTFRHFSAGYEQIYKQDLPLYVSADSILDAIHLSYDDILASLESNALVPGLSKMLRGLSARLKDGHGEIGDSRKDLDLYIAVARALLDGTNPQLVAGGDEKTARAIVAAAKAAVGLMQVNLFGTPRVEDFSQFKPRGHYEGDEVLERYFRAMIWLGRIDLRLIETKSDGSTVFRRRQADATFALYDLFESDTLDLFVQIDTVVQEFVGESDYMVLSEIPDLLAALDAKTPADTKGISDEKIAETIVAGGFGEQRIASHFMVNDGTVATLPLNRSFALLGQRYVVDSHVFSNVVFDRVPDRMMPNPLDVAFAALGNDSATSLLKSELDIYGYHGALNGMRVTVDAHGDDYWTANLYNGWLAALRGLSPSAQPVDVPTSMRGDGWSRRILNAQLGSWAELRHDTVLYAKQSYTLAGVCEFPDAYVDPYPAFYAALVAYADRALAMTERLEGIAETDFIDHLKDHFTTLRASLATLQEMAEQELVGLPFDTEQLTFINNAVRYDPESGGCTGPSRMLGWYPRMVFQWGNDFDPTIADVHTQPTDAGGNPVGKVLHVGTGEPRSTVVTVNTCEGARAYVGLVFAYHEVITKDFERLTDSEWTADYQEKKPADVPWLAPVIR